METSEVTGSDMLKRAELDSLQHAGHGARCGAAGPGQADQERSPIGVVEGAANQSPGLETIEDAAQCGRAVTEVVLQPTDGVRCSIGEEREHMRLALRKTHVGQKFLEAHSRRVSCTLQLDDHPSLELGNVLL